MAFPTISTIFYLRFSTLYKQIRTIWGIFKHCVILERLHKNSPLFCKADRECGACWIRECTRRRRRRGNVVMENQNFFTFLQTFGRLLIIKRKCASARKWWEITQSNFLHRRRPARMRLQIKVCISSSNSCMLVGHL